MACPYFVPTERLELGWQHPERLPLGAGWTGTCAAPGHSEIAPTADELRDCCNLGYSACGRLPADRTADAVRFSVKPCEPGKLRLLYAFERQYLPAGSGVLEFDEASGQCLSTAEDDRLQRLAQCFLTAWRSRR